MSQAKAKRPFGWLALLGMAMLLALPALLLLDDRTWLVFGAAGSTFGLPLGVSSVALYLTSSVAAITAASIALWRFVSSGSFFREHVEACSGPAARIRNTLILLVGLFVTALQFPAPGPTTHVPVCSAREASLVTALAAYALAGMGHGSYHAGIGPGGTHATPKCRSLARPPIGFVLPTWFALLLVLALAAMQAAPSPPPYVPSPLRVNSPPATPAAPPFASQPPAAAPRLAAAVAQFTSEPSPAATSPAATTITPGAPPATRVAMGSPMPYRATRAPSRRARPEDPAWLGMLRASWQQRPVLTAMGITYASGWVLHLLGSSLPTEIALASAPRWLAYSHSGWPVLGLWLACCAGLAVGAGIWLRRWFND